MSSKLLYWFQFQRQRKRFSGIFSHGSVTPNPDKKKSFVLDFGSEHRSLDQSVELSWKERLHLFLSDPDVVLDIKIQMKRMTNAHKLCKYAIAQFSFKSGSNIGGKGRRHGGRFSNNATDKSSKQTKMWYWHFSFVFFYAKRSSSREKRSVLLQKKAGRQKQSWSQSQRSMSIDNGWLKPKFNFRKSGLGSELNL